MIKEGSFSEIILESLESFSRKKAPEQNLREIKIGQYVEYEKEHYVPEGIPEFRWVDFPQLGYLDIKQTRPEEVTREEFDQLVERVKKLEDHTEVHKESFNDYN